jgi:hypothetical protein
VLTNPHVTFGSCFDDFFLVNKGCEHFRIHASPLVGVSVMISVSAPTPFLLTIFLSIGASRASKSTRHLLEVVSVLISESATTQISLTIPESQGL